MEIKFRTQHRSSQERLRDYPLPDLLRGEGLLDALAIVALLVLPIAIASAGLAPFDWRSFAAVVALACCVTLAGLLVLSLLRGVGGRFGTSGILWVGYGLILLAAALCSLGGQWLLGWWQPAGRAMPFSGWLLLQNVAIAAIVVAVVLRYLLLRQQQRLQQQAELESRIQALQSRIRPHFLFNSMNMIASLIGSDPEKAERVVEDLADLFRHILRDSSVLVPLREELALSRRYLALEKLRLGERLQTVWEIGDYGAGAQIPCLTIQPVLENAVYHGIQLIPEGGVVTIRLNRTGDDIDIEVSNPRNPRIQHNKGNRMAMDNIKTRLVAHFGATATVEAEVTSDSYITRIRYTVPPQADEKP
ncbi:MAG: histidine kinase [Porticoccaceae bacterium]